MKWIKASERLPADPYELVCMRGDGGGCYHHETADRSMLIQRLKDDEDAHHKYDPEWLDESQPETIEPDKGKWSDEELTLIVAKEMIAELRYEIKGLKDNIKKWQGEKVDDFYKIKELQSQLTQQQSVNSRLVEALEELMNAHEAYKKCYRKSGKIDGVELIQLAGKIDNANRKAKSVISPSIHPLNH